MRSVASFIALTLLAPAALAAPAQPARPAPVAPAPPPVTLVSIDAATVPDACVPLLKQTHGPALATALSGRLSLVSCMTEKAVAPLQLCDCGESIEQINQAIAPALVILEDVIAHGDAATQAVAQHTKGALYTSLATRLVATLPAPAAGAPESEVALRDMRAQNLETQLTPWRDTARDAYQQVIELAKAHPEVTRNPVATAALRDSQQRLAADVASK